MLDTLILVIHVVVCIALILIILLQTGKGADIGAVFGGGSSQTVFGSSGAGTFLSKITIGAAVVFMVTSIVLTYFSGRGRMAPSERSVVSEQSATTVPVQGTAPEGAAEGQKSEAQTPGAQPAAPVSQERTEAPSGGAPGTPPSGESPSAGK